MLLITGLKLNIGYTERDLFCECKRKMRARDGEILSIHKIKEAIDARNKQNIQYVLNVAVEVKKSYKNFKHFQTTLVDYSGLQYEKVSGQTRPVVVGFGASGMFCALALSIMGLKPIVLEQGKTVDERQRDVAEFWETGKLCKTSNVQFGEGGAGTFSDGKLNSNITNEICKKVINEFILAGAPKEIFYKSKPHIGSDNLVKVVKNIRRKIESLGGQVLFQHKFVDFSTDENQVKSVTAQSLTSGELIEFQTNVLALGVGHSAIDVFELLNKKGVVMQPKPFAMGVRIEHKQKDINLSQYGTLDDRLPPADYKLVAHLENGRSVFTFCMCPGGQVVASSCEEETIVTNGMSNFARDLENANSAVLVNVSPDDFYNDNPLDGLYFQREWEHKAYILGGGNYCAPCEKVGDFLSGATKARDTNADGAKNDVCAPTYKPQVKYADLRECLPPFVADSLKLALPIFDKKIRGFASDNAIMTAIESRSSCPVQVTRNELAQASIAGLFPIGEGAGYAGGIITSAQDGVKSAEKIAEWVTK